MIIFDLTKPWLLLNSLIMEAVKAELSLVGIFFCTQFPSLGIFINKKVGNQKN